MTEPSRNLRPNNPLDAAASAPGHSGHAPHPTGPPPTPPGAAGEVNTLAPLSVVFTFVFAPAAAVLGDMGLSQIARTRQRGRERVPIGVALSYVFITSTVVVMVVWAALRDTGPVPSVDNKLDPPFDAGDGTTARMLYPATRGLGGPRASLPHAIAVKLNVRADATLFSEEIGADNTCESIALGQLHPGQDRG